MLLTIFNLPQNTRYSDVKSLIKSKCGVTEVILDNLENNGGTKKVTVGVAREEDAAMVVRLINGLYVEGQQLYVEDVRKKSTEQPYSSGQKSNNQNIGGYHQPYQSQAQQGFPNQQVGMQQYMHPEAMMYNPMMANMAMASMYYMATPQTNFMEYSGQTQALGPAALQYPQSSKQPDQNVASGTKNFGDERSYDRNTSSKDNGRPSRRDRRNKWDNGEGKSRWDNKSNQRGRDKYRSRSPHRDDGPGLGSSFRDTGPGLGSSYRDDDGPGLGSTFRNDGPGLGSSYRNDGPGLGTNYRDERPGLGSSHRGDGPGLGSNYRDKGPGLGSSHRGDGPGLGSNYRDKGPGLGSSYRDDGPGLGSTYRDKGPGLGSSYRDDGPGLGSTYRDDGPGLGSSYHDDGPGHGSSRRGKRPGRQQTRDDGPGLGSSDRYDRPGLGGSSQNYTDYNQYNQGNNTSFNQPNQTSVQPWAGAPNKSQSQGNQNYRNQSPSKNQPKSHWAKPWLNREQTSSGDIEQTSKTWYNQAQNLGGNNSQAQLQPPKPWENRAPNPGIRPPHPQSGRNKNYSPNENKGQQQQPSQKTLLRRQKKLQTALNRDNTWRQQAAAILGKDIFKRFYVAVPDIVTQGQEVLRRLKTSLKLRMDLLLQGDLQVPVNEIMKKYRKRYPLYEDESHFKAVLEKFLMEPPTDASGPQTQEPQTSDSQTVAQTSVPQTGATVTKPTEQLPPAVMELIKPDNVYTVPAPAPVKKSKADKKKKKKPAPAPAHMLDPNRLPKHPDGNKKKTAEQKKLHKMEYQEDNFYNLDPKLGQVLDEELKVLCDIMKEVLKEAEDDEEKSICERIAVQGVEGFRKAIKVNVTKRLLDIRTHLIVRVYIAGKKPDTAALEHFLKQFGVTSLKKATGRKMFYIAQCDDFKNYDALCLMPNTPMDAFTTLIFRPFQMVAPPPKLTKWQIKKQRKQFKDSLVDKGEGEECEDNDEEYEGMHEEYEGEEEEYEGKEEYEIKEEYEQRDFTFTDANNPNMEDIIDKIDREENDEIMENAGHNDDVDDANLKDEDFEDY